MFKCLDSFPFKQIKYNNCEYYYIIRKKNIILSTTQEPYAIKLFCDLNYTILSLSRRYMFSFICFAFDLFKAFVQPLSLYERPA